MDIKTVRFISTAAITSISALGVNTIIKNAVASTTPEDLSRLKKIGIAFGSVAISGAVWVNVGPCLRKDIDVVWDLIETIAGTKSIDEPAQA